MKYSAKFMEDDNAAYQMRGGVDVDDLTYRMRQALRANKVHRKYLQCCVIEGDGTLHPRRKSLPRPIDYPQQM